MIRSGTTLVASDWHLGHFSAPGDAALAFAFLTRARDAGHMVVLNGDIFEGLFEPAAEAECACPEVGALIAELASAGRLQRTEGNHDPGAGPVSLVLDHATLGAVLVMHGHTLDPLHGSGALRLGDAISRRFGRLAVVRAAARLAESAATLASRRVEDAFRARCRAAVGDAGCAFGVFGHVHRQRLVPQDRYANAGRLSGRRLEYLALTPAGPELACLTTAHSLRGGTAGAGGARATALGEVSCSPG